MGGMMVSGAPRGSHPSSNNGGTHRDDDIIDAEHAVKIEVVLWRRLAIMHA